MTTPALRVLKEAHTGRRITLLASQSGALAAALAPEIDDVMIFDAPWMKHSAPRADASVDGRLIRDLRERHFDAAVIFTVYSQSPLPAALYCYLAQIPRRAACCRENPYQLLTDWVPESEPHQTVRHEVRRQLDLVAHLGCTSRFERLRLSVPRGAAANVRQILGGSGVDLDRAWLVIHPGATAASRRYPAEHFAEVARRLIHAGFQIVFSGTADERSLVDGIRTGIGGPTVSLAGRLKLGEFAALVEMAPVLISNNSGPVHVAAGVGTPVVDIYALTNPQHTPWQVPHRVLSHDVPCKNCYRSSCPEIHHDCLRRIPPAAVFDATIELLAECRTRGLPTSERKPAALAATIDCVLSPCDEPEL